ncbi:MAG: sodium:solute symporter family protein [Oscillospiraceae bacterium]|jgi:SSS family solute:Na+ symporter|nr:sodium:solute symporter family protein [Oscillospiraceae bacterium]
MSIQLIIILLYIAVTVVIGVLSMRKSTGSDSFHGAALGIFAIVAASTGEWLGGTATTGVSEYGFDFGLSGAWYTIANGIGVMFLALCFAKLYRSLNSVTVPGIIEKFFGVKARAVSSILLTIVMLAVGLSQMLAAGKLGETLLGLNFNVTVIVFAIAFIIYTLCGGMEAVASTAKMHLFAMYGGVIIGLIFAVMKLGGVDAFMSALNSANISENTKAALAAANTPVTEAASGDYFNMFRIGVPKVSSWIIASLLGACTAQAGIQPVLAAKDVGSARKACIITAFVAAPFGILTALLGMAAKALFNNGTMVYADAAQTIIVNGKNALPTLMMNIHPNAVLSGIVGGIVLASILAAIISTVSPIILSAGTMVTKDIYQRILKPEASDKQVLFMSRVTTALSGVICAVSAIALVNLSKILDIVYAAYSLRGALFIVVLLGIYWKAATEKGACWSMVCTGIVAVGWKVYNMTVFTINEAGSKVYHYPIADWFTETYAAVLVALIATIVFSLVFPKKTLRAAS